MHRTVLRIVAPFLAVLTPVLVPADLPGQATREARGPTDPAELEAFLDGLMNAYLSDHDIAGATVAVVRDGELLFSGGYGRADVEARREVDPATTLFRIGSVTKLFTWTAVMQLREEGRLDLDADVNEYLDFRIPDTYPEPITLRHLLTHTPGFEDRAFGLFGRTEGTSRGEWLRENLPARVRPPGRHASYSNYGAALGGYVVERVSGMSWEAYLEERILEPLGMELATGRQPLPDELADHMSGGYAYEAGRFVPKPFEWVDAMAPAGSMSASAEAMAPFMIAHLQDGRHGDARILEEETVREMHARAFGLDPRVNGMALGFYEKSSHGLRIIGHAGGTQWFHTDLALVPEAGLGLFVSFNSPGGSRLTFGRFLDAFLDRYYPAPPLAVDEPEEGWDERAASYAGSYRLLRTSRTTFERAAELATRFGVEPGEPGEILVRSLLGTERLREGEPGYFRQPDGSLEVAFAEGPEGEYRHLSLGPMPTVEAEKTGFLSSRLWHGGLLGFSLLLFLSVPVLMPVRYFVQRRAAGVEPLRGAGRGLRWLALGFAVLSLGFLAGLGAVLADMEAFLAGTSEGALRAVLALPVAAVPLAMAVVGGAVVGLRRRLWSGWGRLHYALFALAAVVFLLQLHHWNLLGWWNV